MPRLARPIEFYYSEQNEDYAETGNHYRSQYIPSTSSSSSSSSSSTSNSFINILLTLINSIIKLFNNNKLNRTEYIYLGVFIIFFCSIIYLIK